MAFDKIEAHTRYPLAIDKKRTVLRADSSASASGLIENMLNARNAYPDLTWPWKVTNVRETEISRENMHGHYFTRSTYCPVRVSMRIFSPSLTKGGT
jgi:hypothetical protein